MLINLFIKKRKNEEISKVVSWGHWFCLFNILISFVIASSYLFNSPRPTTILAKFYTIISLLGHFSFIGFALYLLVLFPLTFFIRSVRILKCLAIIIAVISLGLLIVDAYTYYQLGIHLNFTLWSFFWHDNYLKVGKIQLLFGVILIVITLLEVYYTRWSWRRLRSLSNRKIGKILLGLFITCFFCSHIIHIWADATFYRPITSQKSNLPLAYPMTARHFLEKYGLLDLQKYEAQRKQKGKVNTMLVSYPLSRLQYYPMTSQPLNVLVVVLPSLDYHNWQQTMPILAKFSHQSLNYTHYYNVATNLKLNIFSLLYGILPYYYNNVLAEYKPSALLLALINRGYEINLFSRENSHLLSYLFELASKHDCTTFQQYNNIQLVNFWSKWLNSEGNIRSPWFSYINLSELNKNTQSNTTVLESLDKELGVLFNSLTAKSLFSNTVVIITATSDIQPDNMAMKLNISQLNVPLVIYWPGHTAKTENQYCEYYGYYAYIDENTTRSIQSNA